MNRPFTSHHLTKHVKSSWIIRDISSEKATACACVKRRSNRTSGPRDLIFRRGWLGRGRCNGAPSSNQMWISLGMGKEEIESEGWVKVTSGIRDFFYFVNMLWMERWMMQVNFVSSGGKTFEIVFMVIEYFYFKLTHQVVYLFKLL